MSSLDDRDYRSSMLVADRRRTFRVHLPAKTAEPLPLLIALHGTGINGDRMATFCGLSDCADQQGFAVVYPEGTGRTHDSLSWNLGHPSSYAARQGVDDVQFIASLIRHLAEQFAIDRRRVYVTGMSSGAMLCYRLAQRLSHMIAAIGPVAGTMPEPHRPNRALPVIHFHGTADEFVPFHGGVGRRSLTRIDFRSVRESIEWWAELNDCQKPAETVSMANAREDGTQVVREAHLNADGQERVVLFTVEGGGHTWPGRLWPEEPSNPNRLGHTTGHVSANDELWRFFQNFQSEPL